MLSNWPPAAPCNWLRSSTASESTSQEASAFTHPPAVRSTNPGQPEDVPPRTADSKLTISVGMRLRLRAKVDRKEGTSVLSKRLQVTGTMLRTDGDLADGIPNASSPCADQCERILLQPPWRYRLLTSCAAGRRYPAQAPHCTLTDAEPQLGGSLRAHLGQYLPQRS